MKVLIVDDSLVVRTIIENTVKAIGYEALHAGNGQEALAQFAQWRPDLIFMDIRMPVMDGYTATREIRRAEVEKNKSWKEQKNNHKPHIPIIALTSVVFEEEKAKILAAGCDDLLRKPVKGTDIFEILRLHLGVQYVYEVGESSGEEKDSKLNSLPEATGRGSKPEERLMLEALAGLPPDLLSTLEEALIRGNRPIIEQTIESVRSCNAAVAGMVAVMVQEFKYQAIWTMIQEIQREGM